MADKGWMLNNEEIDKVCHEFIDISLFEGDSRAFSRALLKAQARKLVEWLDKRGSHYSPVTSAKILSFCLSEEWWQNFKKGLEE